VELMETAVELLTRGTGEDTSLLLLEVELMETTKGITAIPACFRISLLLFNTFAKKRA